MQEYIIELSKYGITVCMLIYTLISFVTFLLGKETAKPAYLLQCAVLFLTQLLSFLNLTLVSGDKEYLLLYAFVQAFLLAVLVMVPLIYENVHRMLLNNMCMLMGSGFCILSRLSFDKAVRQYIIALVSLIIALFIPYILSTVRFLKRLTWVYGVVGILLLAVVLILGEATHGSKISFTVFGSITFQPSEFVKILFVFFVAGALWEKQTFPRVALTAVIAGLHVIILVVSKDLGSALIFFVGYVFLVFAATGNYLYLLAGAVGGSGAAYAACRLFAHVRRRVMVWRSPWDYIDNEGWAITQSLFAMGSGSWFGMGLLKGNPKSIPYVDQDFIFSAICEELGILYGICLLLITLSCFLISCRIAMQVGDRFYRLIVFGIGIMYLFQIFLTVGGGMNLIPLTGVTLPFLSYGGSSCMTTMIMFFLIQGIYIRLQQRGGVPQMSSEKPKKKPNPKQPILVSGALFSALFVFIIGFLVHFVATSEQDMVNNSYNSRQEILLSQNYRGTIYAAGGEILAETLLDDNQSETRIYPYQNLFSHVVGYSTNGRMGVEAQANYYLINTNTPLTNKVANDMAGVKNPGDNVFTTLDVTLQQVADKQLSVYNGAIIVSEVSTGKILAMVSHPDFDPNKIQEIWDSLLTDSQSSVLLNRATQGLYPPGSTFKIVTALEYIRENPDTYADYSFRCPGYYKHGDGRINCYHGISHGKVDFERSFAKSCNSSFANIGMSLNREEFEKTLEGLLFGGELPLTIRYSESNAAVSSDMTDSAMMQTSIGQGQTQITPVHLNMITNAVANKGVLMKPYVIDHIENDAGTVVKAFKPQRYGSLMSEGEAEILKELMTAVVESGTATKLSGREYTAAGKTGSAEYGTVKGESHAWFTGFAPADEPEVSVTIIVEGAGSGGDYAVPIARQIFDAYFKGRAEETDRR